MIWKVVARGCRPSPGTMESLCRLTGLRRDEVLLALSKEGIVAGSGLSEERAQALADRLSRDPGIACRVLPDSPKAVDTPRFRVLLADFKPGFRTRLRVRLQELTGLPTEQIVLWLSRMPFVLSKSVDAAAARKIRSSIAAAGGIVRVEPHNMNTVTVDGGKSDGAAVFSDAGGSPAKAVSPGSRVRTGAAVASHVTGDPEHTSPAEVVPHPKLTEADPEPLSHAPESPIVPPPLPPSPGAEGSIQKGAPSIFHPHPPPRSESTTTAPPRVSRDDEFRSEPPPTVEFFAPDQPEFVAPPLPGQFEGAESEPPPAVVLFYSPPMSVEPESLLPEVVKATVRKPPATSEPPPVIEYKPSVPETPDPEAQPVLHEGPPRPDGRFAAPSIFHPDAPPGSESTTAAPPRVSRDDAFRSEPPAAVEFSAPDQPEFVAPPLPGQFEGAESGPPPAVVLLYSPPMSVEPESLLPEVVKATVRKPPATSEPPPVIEYKPSVPEPPDPEEQPVLHEGPPRSDGRFAAPAEAETDGTVTGGSLPVELPRVLNFQRRQVPETDREASPVPEGRRKARRSKRKRKRRRVVLLKPPPPSRECPPSLASIHLYLCSPSEEDRGAVAEALSEVLGIGPTTSSELISDCPAWLAGFRDRRRTLSLARELEDRGATVSVVRGALPDDCEPSGSAAGFRAWLASNG